MDASVDAWMWRPARPGRHYHLVSITPATTSAERHDSAAAQKTNAFFAQGTLSTGTLKKSSTLNNLARFRSAA